MAYYNFNRAASGEDVILKTHITDNFQQWNDKTAVYVFNDLPDNPPPSIYGFAPGRIAVNYGWNSTWYWTGSVWRRIAFEESFSPWIDIPLLSGFATPAANKFQYRQSVIGPTYAATTHYATYEFKGEINYVGAGSTPLVWPTSEQLIANIDLTADTVRERMFMCGLLDPIFEWAGAQVRFNYLAPNTQIRIQTQGGPTTQPKRVTVDGVKFVNSLIR